MFDHNDNIDTNVRKERNAKAGDVLVYWLDDKLFSVVSSDPKHIGGIDISPKDDKFSFPLAGSEDQISWQCFLIAKLFAAAVCCEAIPYERPEHLEEKSIGFKLVPFKQ
jgi:hypothetical protein